MKCNAAMVDANIINKIVTTNPKYLIMNSKTFSAVSMLKDTTYYKWLDAPNVPVYRGIPIAIYDGLPFGEIETVKE